MRASDLRYEKSGANVQMKYTTRFDHEVNCWGVVNSNDRFVFTTDTKHQANKIVASLNDGIKNW